MNKWASAFCILWQDLFCIGMPERSGYTGNFLGGLYSIFGSEIFLLLGVIGSLCEIFRLRK